MDITKLTTEELVAWNNKREFKMQSMRAMEDSVDEMLEDSLTILSEICLLLESELDDQDVIRCYLKSAIVMLKQIKPAI